MQPKLSLPLAALLLSFSGCKGDPGAAGPAGPKGEAGDACTLDAAATTPTLRCAEGEITLLPSCSVDVDGGLATIDCGEREPMLVLEGTKVATQIVGVVKRLGQTGHGGIDVELLPLGLEAKTNARGQFEFDEVPAGVYQLRASAEGYPSLEVDRVVAVGRTVDLGELTLRKGHFVGAGIGEVMPSADGSRVIAAVQSLTEGLKILYVDLVSGERIELPSLPDLGMIDFFGEDHLVISTYSAPYNEAFLFELETGELRPLGPFWNGRPMVGGFLYTGVDLDADEALDEAPFFLPVGAETPIRIGGERMSLSAFIQEPLSQRYARLTTAAAPARDFLFDSLAPASLVPLADKLARQSPSGELVAFFRQDPDDGPSLSVLELATGSIRDFGPTTPTGAVWSADERVIAVPVGAEIHVFDLASGSRTIVPEVGLVGLSSTGRYLALEGVGHRRVVSQGVTPVEDRVFSPGEIFFSDDDRWIVSLTPDRILAVEATTDELQQFDEEGIGETLHFIGDTVVYRVDRELVRRDLAARSEERFLLGARERVVVGETMAFFDEAFELTLLHGDGTLSRTGITTASRLWPDGSGDAFLVVAAEGRHLYRVLAEDGAVELLEDTVLVGSVDTYPGFSVYIRSNIDFLTLFETFDLDALEVYLVPHP